MQWGNWVFDPSLLTLTHRAEDDEIEILAKADPTTAMTTEEFRAKF